MPPFAGLLLITLLVVPACFCYTPPFANTGPVVQIGCDVTYAKYLAVEPGTAVSFGAAGSAFQLDPSNCPLVPSCALSPSAPFTCWDGSCAASPRACNSAAPFSCPVDPLTASESTKTPTRCWDGSCSRGEPFAMRLLLPETNGTAYSTLFTCPPLPPCPTGQVRCWDLSCVAAGSGATDPCTGYTFSQLVSDCSATTASSPQNAYACCGGSGSYGMCGAYRGCTFGEVACPDGTCQLLANASLCNTGCPAGQYRCYGKIAGNCVSSLSLCPAPPSTSLFVNPFTAVVGPLANNGTTASATRLSLTNAADGTELGWLGVPPLNSAGPVHVNVFNYFGGAQLSDEETALCGVNWQSCKHAPLSIFSPIVGLASFDLVLLYANKGDGPTYNTASQKLVDSWALEVVLPVQLPEDVSEAKMCLAYTDLESVPEAVLPVRSQAVWLCVDRYPVLYDNSTSPPLYRGYVPLSLVIARAEPFVHMAFVHDTSDDFGRVETIGGGFFAAGIALLVVGSTILLANREKLVGRIYNDGTGTSTSAM